MKILVINAGSSSLKYQLIDMESETVMAKGLCERIGISQFIHGISQPPKMFFCTGPKIDSHRRCYTGCDHIFL